MQSPRRGGGKAGMGGARPTEAVSADLTRELL